MKRHSSRIKGRGFYELKVLEIKGGKARRDGTQKVSEIILNYPDKNKRLSLRPTKGYKLEKITNKVN